METIEKKLIIPTPEELRLSIPIDEATQNAIEVNRTNIAQILSGEDSRRLAIIGPCSIDGSEAVHRFWELLAPEAKAVSDKVMTVIRAPVSKPRTIGGWRGLVEDSLELSRRQLTKLAQANAPVAIEFIEPHELAMFGDTLSLGWVGARTVLTPSLRLEASRNPDLPVLFKNGIDGSILAATHARQAAAMSHRNVTFMSEDGRLAVCEITPGNQRTLTILRGGISSENGRPVSNINKETILEVESQSENAGLLNSGVIVDIAHSNAAAAMGGLKVFEGQIIAFYRLLKVASDPSISHLIRGVMIEAFLHDGRGQGFGQSRTDPTVSINTSIGMLHLLAEASP